MRRGLRLGFGHKGAGGGRVGVKLDEVVKGSKGLNPRGVCCGLAFAGAVGGETYMALLDGNEDSA